jgi:serine/threonine-protein kinase
MIKRKLGKYDILGWIGGGQFADVYLAKDTITKARFALKVSRLPPKVKEELLKEAELLVNLDHPNIVRFYSADIIEGRLVIALEYVDGSSLREVIKREAPLSLKDAIPIIRQMCEALIYAHSQNVLHRDIKPENILLTKKGVVKITDFGLAILLSEDSLKASMAGTPLYMAPESWKGIFSQYSDQWSLAAVIYELLTGSPPFYAENLEDLRRSIQRGKPRENPAIPVEVRKVIFKALSRDPLERF